MTGKHAPASTCVGRVLNFCTVPTPGDLDHRNRALVSAFDTTDNVVDAPSVVVVFIVVMTSTRNKLDQLSDLETLDAVDAGFLLRDAFFPINLGAPIADLLLLPARQSFERMEDLT